MKIKLLDNNLKSLTHDGYELDPNIKYVIDFNNDEKNFQSAVMESFRIMGNPPALKNYHAWLSENGFSVDSPNPTNIFVAKYYGVKPLWKTKYSQGIVVKSEDKNDTDFYIVMECSRLNKGYKHTKAYLHQVDVTKYNNLTFFLIYAYTYNAVLGWVITLLNIGSYLF